MRIIIPMILIAGILPIIATNLSGKLINFSGILWVISGIIFLVAGYLAYKENKKNKQSY
ncbi:hypothetical protein MXM59_10860 [Mammaliicoccus sciuri]|uniref:hypothetical protein n=1 Tax=Mammaliicoccus sciuri TaxID=1296 RepID=UPI002DBC354A|nr:hypothetical protein [Mammaliicoccus sciuri]MEB6227728.1 hypothetical protein [Mammaliicoccus sciuri]